MDNLFEAINTGFDDLSSPPPVAVLERWTVHGASDPFVHWYQHNTAADILVGSQFNYARGGGADDFLIDLRGHPIVSGRAGQIARRGMVNEESICRAGSLQRMSDVARYTVLQANPDPGSATFDRSGVSTWSHHTSDAPKVEFGPFMLPCGFSLSPYERDAFNDNWRALTGPSALGNPSDPANTAVNPLVTVVDRDLSDAVQVGLAQSPDGKAMLVVYADNYSTSTTHSRPQTNPPYANANKLFARVRYQRPAQPGTWIWYPALGTPPLVLDAGPGPLLFDEDRRSVCKETVGDTTDVDLRYSSEMGYVNNPPSQPPVDYNGIDWEPFPPTYAPNNPPATLPAYLRLDTRNRIKRRSADCDLQPSAVFQKKAGDDYRFFVAWSRPVPKTASVGVANPVENYFPDQDQDQKYFVMHKGHVPNDSTTYRKYEVLLQEVTVRATTASGSNPIVAMPNPLVMRTWGELPEGVSNGPEMESDAVAAYQAGAAAMHPRLFVEPTKGHMVLAYMKSQDSWFDIAAHPGGLTINNIQAWEQSSVWHVYPWEVWAKVYAEYGDAATLNGAWVQMIPQGSTTPVEGEWRVNDQYPNGGLGGSGSMAGWLQDHRYLGAASSYGGYQMPASPKGQFTAEYFPVVDPAGAAWMESTTLNFVISFKALNTWIDPTYWHYPHGYETMAVSFTCPISSGASTQVPPTRSPARRLRVPFAPLVPVDDEGTGILTPPPYASYDVMYDMNEAPVAYTPTLGGMKATVAAQNGQRIALNHDAFSGNQEQVISPSVVTYTGTARVFSSSMQSASVQKSGYDIYTVAWLYLEPAAPGGHPRVDLKVWGRVGTLSYNPVRTYRVALTATEGADFQGRVLSVTPAGNEPGTGCQQFAVVWHQSGRIFRLVYTLDWDPNVVPPALVFPTAPFDSQSNLASVTQVAKGATDMFNHPNAQYYLSSAKLKAAAAANAGVWAIKGWVNFKDW